MTWLLLILPLVFSLWLGGCADVGNVGNDMALGLRLLERRLDRGEVTAWLPNSYSTSHP